MEKQENKKSSYTFYWFDGEGARSRGGSEDTYYVGTFELESDTDALLLALSIQGEWGNADVDNVEEYQGYWEGSSDDELRDALLSVDAGDGSAVVYGIKKDDIFIYDGYFESYEEEREENGYEIVDYNE